MLTFPTFFAVLKEGAVVGPYASLADAQKAGTVTINYGLFINSIIGFLIVAFAIFMLIRSINKMRREEEAPAAPETKECPFCFFSDSGKSRTLPELYFIAFMKMKSGGLLTMAKAKNSSEANNGRAKYSTGPGGKSFPFLSRRNTKRNMSASRHSSNVPGRKGKISSSSWG